MNSPNFWPLTRFNELLCLQSFGGLTEVIQRKRWGKIAEYLRIPKGTQDPGKKLDDIYCKYILPYDTLSPVERDELLRLVEEEHEEANKRKLERSRDVPNTFHLGLIMKQYTCVFLRVPNAICNFCLVGQCISGQPAKESKSTQPCHHSS